MSKRVAGQEDHNHTAWFVDHIIKCHKSLDCPHDALSVALKVSTLITSMRDFDDDDEDYDSFQMDLFNYLREDVNARNRPTAFVMAITNRLHDLIDDKHFTSANVGLCFQVASSSKSKAQGKTPTTSNKTTSKSKSSKSGPASQLGGRILESSFAAASTTGIQAENSGCAAGLLCTALPHNTFESGHKCYACDGKIHSALLCGLQLSEFILIDFGDFDGNEQRAICHQCINRFKNSKRMSIPWSCHKCDKEWPQTVKRCGACKAWKGGTRQPSTGVKKRKTTSQAKAKAKTKTKSTKKGKGCTIGCRCSEETRTHKTENGEL